MSNSHSIPFALPQVHAAFIGSAGIPNRYGGFEAFVEFCGPVLARRLSSVTVTCDKSLYKDRDPCFEGVYRKFLSVRANGGSSILHDLLAFFRVYRKSTHIIVLGVSGGPWFPLFRMLCTLGNKRLMVNIDGVEWRRTKFGFAKRALLWIFDVLAQRCAHMVIYDNPALLPYVRPSARRKAAEIAYPGDHVLRLPGCRRDPGTALTVCRIEPENNIDMLIEGFKASSLRHYTIVGNWEYSEYGRQLRTRYADDVRLQLLDPIYDAQRLAGLRESCAVYIHGHSVGGTNPSLVEMLFYDCNLLCFDVAFHRATVGGCARYFGDAAALTELLDTPSDVASSPQERQQYRDRYSRDSIASRYINAMMACGGQAGSALPCPD